MGKCSYVTLGLFGLVMLMQRGESATFTVGGSKGWSVPSDNSAVYNQWAEKMRFQIGDSLLFVYQSSSDSVLQVSKEDFDSCNTNSPIAKFSDGHTDFKLKQSGPYYFISGNKDNCNKNEKIVVVVLADRTGKNSPPSPLAPGPAPTTTASPPSPTATTTDVSPVPSAEDDHPNGAASVVMSLGSVAALVGSSLLMAF